MTKTRTKYAIELVEWLDAAYKQGPNDPEEFDDETDYGCLIQTVGFVLKDTKDFLIITMEHWPDDDFVRHTTEIPKSWIIKRQRLK